MDATELPKQFWPAVVRLQTLEATGIAPNQQQRQANHDDRAGHHQRLKRLVVKPDAAEALAHAPHVAGACQQGDLIDRKPHHKMSPRKDASLPVVPATRSAICSMLRLAASPTIGQ